MTYSIFAHTMADMTYPELERAAETGTPVLLPIGVIEEHGPHLPLGTDIYGAYQLAVLVRERLAADGADALIAPPLYWGINQVTSAFTGSFTISPKTARALLDDVLDSLLDQGFDRILLINHHGDRLHNQMLLDAVRRQHDRGSREVRWLESDRIIDRLGGDREDPVWLYYAMPSETETLKSATTLGVHANDQETALVARWFPNSSTTRRCGSCGRPTSPSRIWRAGARAASTRRRSRRSDTSAIRSRGTPCSGVSTRGWRTRWRRPSTTRLAPDQNIDTEGAAHVRTA